MTSSASRSSSSALRGSSRPLRAPCRPAARRTPSSGSGGPPRPARAGRRSRSRGPLPGAVGVGALAGQGRLALAHFLARLAQDLAQQAAVARIGLDVGLEVAMEGLSLVAAAGRHRQQRDQVLFAARAGEQVSLEGTAFFLRQIIVQELLERLAVRMPVLRVPKLPLAHQAFSSGARTGAAGRRPGGLLLQGNDLIHHGAVSWQIRALRQGVRTGSRLAVRIPAAALAAPLGIAAEVPRRR